MFTQHSMYDKIRVKLTPTGERFVRGKRVSDNNPHWLVPDSDGYCEMNFADLCQFFGHLFIDGQESPIEFRFLLKAADEVVV